MYELEAKDRIEILKIAVDFYQHCSFTELVEAVELFTSYVEKGSFPIQSGSVSK